MGKAAEAGRFVPPIKRVGFRAERQAAVKRSTNPWRTTLRDHSAFFSYRWLAWVIAALALTLPGRPVQNLPREAGLLLLIGVINVAATALAQGYVRIAAQRPILLALDLTAGAAVLWLSGSDILPFLPYALSGLILPALLFQWRGALVGAAAFIVLDLLGLALINPEFGGQLGGVNLVVRALVPTAFAALWVVLRVWLAHDDPSVDRDQPAARPSAAAFRFVTPPPGSLQLGRAPRPVRPEQPEPLPNPSSTASSLVLDRAAPLDAGNPPRRALPDLGLDAQTSLREALERLGATIGAQASLSVQVHERGTPYLLSWSYQVLLLRIAYEALVNVQHHAHAQHALIQLHYTPEAIALTVQDDGTGLLDGTYERPGLHALRALRYRLVEFEGTLAVIEPESGGVTVRAELPRE